MTDQKENPGWQAGAGESVQEQAHEDVRPAVEVTQAQRFLDLLDPEAETWRFRTFPDQGGADNGRKYGGDADAVATALQLDNGKGRGVFVVVNEGGDDDRSITRIRAVYADFDPPKTNPMPARFDLEPHLIVESSPGCHHAYWLVDGLAVGDFKRAQQAIAARYGSDPAVCNPSRVMRVPGFLHRKGEPFRSRIIHESGALPYQGNVIMETFKAKAGKRTTTTRSTPGGIPESKRDTTLASIAGSMRRKGMSAEQILPALREVNQACHPPLADADLQRIARSIGRYEPDPAEVVADGAHDPCTHLANAHRLVKHYGDRLLYVQGVGWHTWSPPWRLDELGARRLAQGLGKLIAREAAALGDWVADARDSDERERREVVMKARWSWAKSSEFVACIESSLKAAEPLLTCDAADMDANPDILGLPSGVLELATGEHREHRQEDRLTRVAGCNFDPAATCPTWQRFVTEIMGGDAELLDFAQRLAGYALTGHRGEHLLPILWGAGANGKSTFLGTLQAVMGEYASTAAPGLLIAKGGNEHPTGLADLQGRRLVVVSETGEAGRLNEEQVKALTGGDRITARRMRQDFYQFDPTHLLILQTNHKPRVAGTDEGIWRRLRLLPFTVTVPADKRDARLPGKLRAELPGILAWALDGLRRYQRDGFRTPASVTAATSEYRDASDQVGAFLAEACEEGDGFTVTSGELYRAYETWCKEAGERPRNQREFGMRLSERGYDSGKGAGGVRRWRGLRIQPDSGGTSGTSGGCFGLSAKRASTYSAYTESTATSATSATNADAYRTAKDGG